MPNFPLFRLDRSSLSSVFKKFDSIQLLNISLCSTKSFKIAKEVLRDTKEVTTFHNDLKATIRFWIDVDVDENWIEISKIFCKKMEDSCLCPTRLNTGEMNGVPYLETQVIEEYGTRYESTMTFYWANEQEGTRLLIEHFSRLYDMPKLELRMDVSYPTLLETLDFVNCCPATIADASLYCSDRHKNKKLIDWSRGLEEVMDQIRENACSCSISSKHTSEILDRLKSAKELNIGIIPEQDFIENDKRQYGYDQLKIFKGSWVRPKHLFAMNCKDLFVDDSSFSNEDVNWFLKEWIKGAWPRMEEFRLRIKLDTINLEAIVDNIPISESRSHHMDLNAGAYLNRYLTVMQNNGKKIRIYSEMPLNPHPVRDEYVLMVLRREVDEED